MARLSRKELEAALAGLRSRGAIKAFGARVDRDPALRRALVELARARGLAPDPDAPGKRLVRLLLDRSEAARRRGNPVRVDEAFTCAWCGRAVPPGGARVRDHCPWCLRGLHVDRVPGDRAAGCGGVLEPVGFELRGGEVIVRWRCLACGHRWRGRAHPDDRVPPSLDPADLPGPAERAEPARPAADPLEERARTLPLRVLEVVRRHRLWRPGQPVVVAVSGGLDSRALLELLHRTRGAHGGRLVVATLDHGLRPEAVEETARVAREAAALGLPCRVRRLDVAPGPNLQARARAARRAALLALARAEGDDAVVATGHHEDDQAETVLYRLLRGSGATGLRGMALRDPPWVRPLLFEPRAVVAAWARREGLRWVEDPSNPGSLRGRMRPILDELDALHGGARRALARSARLLARDDALLDELAAAEHRRLDRDGGVDLAGLRALHPALQLRVLRRLVAAAPPGVRADQLERFLTWEPREGGRLPLPGGWALVVVGGVLRAGPAG